MNDKQSETLAIVFITGFAIQRANEILDPFVMALIRWYKSVRPGNDLPGGMTDADFKKALIAAMSFVFGVMVVASTGIRLLNILADKYGGIGDFLITALVVGAGTEAVNTVVKFFAYVKDAQKPLPGAEVSIAVVPESLKVGTTFHFRAVVKNGTSQDVTWAVLHGAGGDIDANTGLYIAPSTPGRYLIQATSRTDPTKFATATVNVVA